MYPVMLNLKNKQVLVVGGGQVAARKLSGLIGQGARITQVSPLAPVVPPELQSGTDEHIQWIARAFEETDIEGMDLVFAATNNPHVNRKVACLCWQRGIWVNDTSEQERSNFTNPAVVEKEGVTIAVTTNGASPSLSKLLCDRFAKAVPRGAQKKLLLLRAKRVEINRSGLEKRQRYLKLRKMAADVLKEWKL